MTGLELKEYLAKRKDEELAELHVTVPIAGLSGSHVDVKSVYEGTDWENGHLVMSPTKWLNTIPMREISLLRDFWLKKNSNKHKLWKTKKGSPFIGEYKKLVSPPFEREFQAQLWISDRMREDLDNLLK
jgi:hypothetical protein